MIPRTILGLKTRVSVNKRGTKEATICRSYPPSLLPVEIGKCWQAALAFEDPKDIHYIGVVPY
jgi:hypothetical protein